MDRILVLLCDKSDLIKTALIKEFARINFGDEDCQIIRKAGGIKKLLYPDNSKDFDLFVKDLAVPANLHLVDRILLISHQGCNCLNKHINCHKFSGLDKSLHKLKEAKNILKPRVAVPIDIIFLSIDETNKSWEIKNISDLQDFKSL